MSRFEIIPYDKVGDISFKLTREAVRKLLGNEDPNKFKKSKSSENEADDFGFCHVHYDKNNKVEAVEFFGEIELVYKGKNLFSFPYNEMLQFLGKNSSEYSVNDSGVIVEELGIAAYVPDKRTIESILVYRRGYYD